MRLKIAAALAALPPATLSFSSPAQAANVYAACFYQDDMGKLPVTQLFKLEGDALRDYYGEWTYEKNKVWEEQFAKEPWDVRGISGFYEYNFVGQFSKLAKEQGVVHSNCWVTTSKDRAHAWFAREVAKDRLDTSRHQNWRPTKAGVVAVEDWSGRPSAGTVETEADARNEVPAAERSASDEAAPKPPARPKMSNAEADAKYEAEMAEYRKKLAVQQEQVAAHKRAEDDLARKKQEQKAAAERAATDYQRQLAAHADTVRVQQLEYQKQVAKPYDAPNAVYRGFWGPNCEAARRSATHGAGTSSTTRFKEVTTETPDRGCVVQGWWWNVAGGGTATRQ